MNKEEIKEKILLEKNASLIDVIEIAGNYYAKALVNSSDEDYEIRFEYYKIYEDSIFDLNEEELSEVKSFFEINLGNIVY